MEPNPPRETVEDCVLPPTEGTLPPALRTVPPGTFVVPLPDAVRLTVAPDEVE